MISRVGAARPLSIKLTCRCVVCAATARPSCDSPRRPRHSLRSRPNMRRGAAGSGCNGKSAASIRGTISARRRRANSLRGNCRPTVPPTSCFAKPQEGHMLQVALAGTFAACLDAPLRRHLRTDARLIVASEAEIVPQLAETDVLVTMAFTPEMARRATRLKLVQVAGAGLDRIDRSALPEGAALANVYGHETGIAEYAIGAMLALSREFFRVDAALRHGEWQSQWAVGAEIPPVWPELSGKTLGLLGYGRIGQAVARRARAFDMRICAIRRNLRSE